MRGLTRVRQKIEGGARPVGPRQWNCPALFSEDKWAVLESNVLYAAESITSIAVGDLVDNGRLYCADDQLILTTHAMENRDVLTLTTLQEVVATRSGELVVSSVAR